jgi:O-antigen ligase
MFNTVAEKTTASLILIGAPLTTLFLLTDTVTDPVNVTKLFIAGGFGFSLFFVTIGFSSSRIIANFKLAIVFFLLFVVASINSVINSKSPLTQNLYGVFGRNSGFITYLLLAMIGVGALGLRTSISFRKVIYGLQFAGLINVIYCGWVLAFGDFLSWSNPYGNILGLFGNPDFISAYLGIFISSLLAMSLSKSATWKYRILSGVLALLAFYEIVRSHAIQGIVVTAGGIAIVGFFAIHSYLKNQFLTLGYVVIAIGVGILGILGALQKGPMSFVYKTSVSLRGAYWHAGITMGMDHPLTGVGMDAYGDWYRRARSLNAATVLPGPGTISNAAHNVIVDFFAYGGFPLLISYLGILVVVAISAFKVIRREKSYDPIFVALFAAWACYQLQSVISINQIGLALWGWLLSGSLIAYEYVTRPKPEEKSNVNAGQGKGRGKRSSGVISPQLVAGIGALIGSLISVPPLSADIKWRSAMDARDANKVIAANESSYMNPADSQRLAQAVQLFANSNLMDQAHQAALKGVAYNPDYFDAWKFLYSLSNSSTEERNLALKNMKRLDPLNPDVTK